MLASLATVFFAVPPCMTSLDCGLNGDCLSGSCVCDHGRELGIPFCLPGGKVRPTRPHPLRLDAREVAWEGTGVVCR